MSMKARRVANGDAPKQTPSVACSFALRSKPIRTSVTATFRLNCFAQHQNVRKVRNGEDT
jgi:hypothetical protein